MSPASGDVYYIGKLIQVYCLVSIQLMSPASGDKTSDGYEVPQFMVSIQLMSPASGDRFN